MCCPTALAGDDPPTVNAATVQDKARWHGVEFKSASRLREPYIVCGSNRFKVLRTLCDAVIENPPCPSPIISCVY